MSTPPCNCGSPTCYMNRIATLESDRAALMAEVERLRAFVHPIVSPTPQPYVLGGSYPPTDCPIYGGRRKGWTCLDEQQWAQDESHPCGDELRAALKSGAGLCLKCRAVTLLAGAAPPSPPRAMSCTSFRAEDAEPRKSER